MIFRMKCWRVRIVIMFRSVLVKLVCCRKNMILKNIRRLIIVMVWVMVVRIELNFL